MRKRLQKRLHKGRFAEYGFHLSVRIAPEASPEAFLDEFIEGGIEARGAYFGGGCRVGLLEGFVEVGRRDENPQARRAAVLEWLNRHEHVEAVDAGDLVDAWYGRE